MSIVNVGIGQTSTISTSGNNDVTFLGLGNLVIAGPTGQPPISVTLSSVAGLGLLDQISISNADVTLGTVSASLLSRYSIGSNGTLRIGGAVGVSAGLNVEFTAPASRLVLDPALGVGVLSGVSGFAPGSSIDVHGTATSLTYADAGGTNTGGTLTLQGPNGTVATVPLLSGEYTASSFSIQGDGNGGTLIGFGSGVTGVTATAPTAPTGTGIVGLGGTVAIDLNLSNPVTVTGGLPTLQLSDGSTAVYDPTHSTGTSLVFTHAVQPGETSADLTISGVNLNGATVADLGGLVANLAGAAVNPAGVLQLDGIAPVVQSVTMTPSTLDPGHTVVIGVGLTEPVTVIGTPTLTLSDGGIAIYDPTLSTGLTLGFTHTVPPGQSTGGTTVTGVGLNGATITDPAGNPVTLTGVTSTPITPTTPITPSTIDVYRFFDTKFGTHFYTSDPSERAQVLATRSDLVPEGPGGVGLTAVNPASGDPNAVPVFRFFDQLHGTHFFTASATERDSVIATRKDLVFEPNSSFYEHATLQAGDTAVYRFFDSQYGTHFYTDSASERANILQTRPDLVAEGIGFYEPAKS